jgi:hypothetical protein
MAGAAVLALVAAVGARSLSGDRGPAPSATAAETATAPARKEAPETARVTITATPAEARIFVDGAEAPTNPFVATLRRDGVTHAIRVEAPGYEPRTRAFPVNGDSTIDLALVAVAPPPATPAAAAPRAAPASSPKPSRVAAPAAVAAPTPAPAPSPPAETPAPAKRPTQAIDGTNPYGN